MQLTLAFDVPVRPQCPGCTCPLDARNIAFWMDVGFCWSCVDNKLMHQVRTTTAIYLKHVIAPKHKCSSRGIQFFTPRVQVTVALDLAEELWTDEFRETMNKAAQHRLTKTLPTVSEQVDREYTRVPLDNLDSPLP